MIYYELKIESAEEEIEIINDKMIKFAEVHFDTVNEKSQKKSNDIVTRMEIRGQIDPTINDALIKISNWTRDLSTETTYRNVTLTIKEDQTKIFRIYEVPEMFVCDYIESYGEAKDSDMGMFTLKLIQKENMLKEIKTYK